MTVQSTKNKIQHSALQDQTDFVYDFVVLQEEDVNVLVNDLIYPGFFNVTNVGDNDGGLVILDSGLEAGDIVVIYRLMEPTQEIDYTPYDGFPAETHERGLDKLTLLVQQLNDFSIGSVRFPIAEIFGPNSILPPIDERSLKYLFFDFDGGVGVSEGTAIGGEGVKSVSVLQDGVSPTLIGVDNSDTEAPKIFIIEPNQPNRLVTLDQFGHVPADSLPGLSIQSIAVTADSVDMLKTDNATDPENPAVGVDGPNLPLGLVQLDSAGLIDPDLVNWIGLRNLGLVRGDNLCDKQGDGLGVCVVPDHRNPSERFLSGNFQGGDYFIITMLAPEVSGEMNLFSESGDTVTTAVTVEAGDGIIFFNELRDDLNDLVLSEGWYFIEDMITTTSAEFVAYDPTGNLIITPADINVQLALVRLDTHALDRVAGGAMTLPITYVPLPVLAEELINKGYADGIVLGVQQEVDALDVRVSANEIDINDLQANLALKLEADDYATSTVGGTIKIRLSGNDAFISTTGLNP